MKQTLRGLITAPCLLLALSSVGWSAEGQPDPLIATVNGHDIHLSYVYQQIESLPLGEQVALRDQFDRFVESIIQEEVLLQATLKTKFQDEPELRDQIKHTIADYLINKYVTRKIHVTDKEVGQYYRDNASAIRNELVQVSHILLKVRAECEALQKQINSKEEFAQLAQQRSLHKDSAKNGGDIGSYMNHAGALGFEQRFFDMKVGEMDVFESTDGCHLVRITDRVTPPLPPLAEVSDRIRELITRSREIELLSALIKKSRSQVEVIRHSATQNK